MGYQRNLTHLTGVDFMRAESIKSSKFLSKVLRHRPDLIGIQLDPNGWVNVEELIHACRKHGVPLDRETLEQILRTNDKQRFAFSEDRQKIRANQGHSVAIDLNLDPVKPPDLLFHGTALRFLPSIRKKGLLKGNRHHVHLSPDPVTARRVGKRHGTPVVLQILSREMHRDGYTFFQSANGVWLTEFVPVRYLRENPR
jgi:putative RNA 2'-phosphotransferase